MVLHDVNQACRYADHIVAMKDGRIVAQGPPAEAVTAPLIEDVFALRCQVHPDPSPPPHGHPHRPPPRHPALSEHTTQPWANT